MWSNIHKNFSQTQRIIVLFFLTLLCFQNIDAQSKQKKRYKKKNDDNSAMGNRFQDLTSRDNYYFNGKMLMIESFHELKAMNTDDYEEILSLFTFGVGSEASLVHGKMDQILEKASNDIDMHPNSKWLDDQYLLIGQAQIVKGRFSLARESFDVIMTKFGGDIRVKENIAKIKPASTKGQFGVGQLDMGIDIGLDSNSQLIEELEKKAKDKVKAKIESEKERQLRNQRKRKLKKINDKRRKKGLKPLTYKEKYGEEIYGINTGKEVAKEESTIPAVKTTPKEKKEEDKTPKVNSVESEKSTVEYAESKGWLKHKSVFPEAMLWKAFAYMQEEQFGEALTILDRAKQNSNFPKKSVAFLFAQRAEINIKREEWKKAIVNLDQTIEFTKKKIDKGRLYFIAAQINEKIGDSEAALAAYESAAKCKTNYEIEFQSVIKSIELNLRENNYDLAQAERKMLRLLKDDKNIDYQDQIYFKLAEISIIGGDLDKAVSYLNKATESSDGNDEQKSLAYLKLAEIFYTAEEYEMSAAYYDSALISLSKDYKDYEKIAKRSAVLTDLATNLTIAEREDSLQRISRLPKAELNRIIDDEIARLEAIIEAEQEALEESQFEDENENTVSEITNESSSGQFYFYNKNEAGKGYNKFMDLYGDRPLVDNWRRITEINSAGFVNLSAEEAELVELAKKGELSRDEFLKNLPNSPDDYVTSNNKILNGLYNAAKIYREKLEHNEKAKLMFQELLERFPASEYSEEAHYTLYLIHKEEGNEMLAKEHEDILRNQYADGLYTKLLDDENYVDKMVESQNEQEQFYEETYRLFDSGQYELVLERKTEAEQLFVSNSFSPQLQLLEAFVIGHQKDKAAYITALNSVVKTNPKHEVKDKAEEILKYLNKKETDKKDKQLYTLHMNKDHFVIASFGTSLERVDEALSNVSDHNTVNFPDGKLKVKTMLFNGNNHLVYVSTFQSGEEALLYYEKMKESRNTLFDNVHTGVIDLFVISKENFTIFYKNKDVLDYMNFFEKNYLGQ